ncbi:MAG: hypothetical protein JJU11_14020 [Candidatus Sumerlaeia bacterium]|nr:hypothetical protein [Candidatus Sumerlaeia bacterium]
MTPTQGAPSSPIEEIVALERPVPFVRAHRTSPLRLGGAALLAGFFLLLFVEVLLLWVPKPREETWLRVIEPAPGVLYRISPGFHADYEATINLDGFRSREVTPLDPDGFRVLALGDSTVFGLFSGDDTQPWPAQLETLLRDGHGENRPLPDVVNMGVVAFSSEGALANLKIHGERYGASAIVVGVGAWNDYQIFHEDTSMTDIEAVERDFFGPDMAAARSSFQFSGLWRWNRGRYWARKSAENTLVEEVYLEKGYFTEEAAELPRRVPLPRFREVLREFVAWGDENGAAVVFIVPALNPEADLYSEARYPIARVYREAVREAVAEFPHVRGVDAPEVLGNAMLEGAAPGDLWVDWVHLTPRGNELLAREVYTTLASMDISTFPAPRNGGASQ